MAGRVFAYNELGEDNPVRITEEEIRRTYWPHWVEEMNKALDRNSPNVTPADLTWEKCLEDFIVVNWAWEVKDGEPYEHGV
jgi:hypothetical protein